MTRKASRRKKKITKYITSVGPDIDLYAPPQCLMEGNAVCHMVSRTVKVAQYFQAIRSFPDRAIFRAEWIERGRRIPGAGVCAGRRSSSSVGADR
jgi:hypothetical protein